MFFFYGVAGSLIINLSANLIIDALHYADFLWILLTIIFTFFGLGSRWGLFFLFLNLIGIAYFIFFTLEVNFEAINQISIGDKITLSIEMAACLSITSYVIYQFVKIRQTTELELIKKNIKLEESNTEIHKQNEEKTILVKEIHHRVKNNLQIIISLLRLQMTDINNVESKKHFSEAINRVMVMSSIHQKLYKEQELSKFSLVSYIDDLSSELKQFFLEEFPVEINIESDYRVIDLKTVVPLGLILNELLSNSFKYAFTGLESGEISILLKDKGDYFDLIYFDSGDWIEPNDESSGFGIELINTLSEQLNGTVEFRTEKEGTYYKFHLQKVTD
jgi:two-component sensor histidine kinase